MKIKATNIRVGDILDIDGVLQKVMVANHVTPGKGKAHMQFKLKNQETGNQMELRMNSDDMAEKAFLESSKLMYQYQDGDHYVFMNMENYEQVFIHKEDLEEQLPYMLPDVEVTAYNYEGRVLSIELPNVVELEITETAPQVKGATVTNQPKPATLETGIVINVPNFIEAGEKIRVDTRSGEYVERASK